MRSNLLITAFVILVLILWTGPIFAQENTVCKPYDEMIATLAGPKHHEQPRAGGTLKTGAFFLFVNPNNETWTIFQVDGAGKACIVGFGKNYTEVPFAKKPAPGIDG